MKLNRLVNWSIYNYPMLHRNRDYATSRLTVLNHLFFTNGNGYEWDKTGFLYSDDKRAGVNELPEGFFDKKLYDLNCKVELADEFFNKFASNRFFYFTARNRWNKFKGSLDCIFEAKDDADALPIYEEFSVKTEYGADNRQFFVYEIKNDYDPSPYPLCKYAKLMEIYTGKEALNPSVVVVPKPDWLAGCIEIAEYAVGYFHDESRYVHDSYHWSKQLIRLKNDTSENPHWKKNLRTGETPEQFAERIWSEYRFEQLAILDRFLKKFKN